MSVWMFLPFAIGVLSFVGVSVFKKIRQSKTANVIPYGVSVLNKIRANTAIPEPETGIPAIDKAIADGDFVLSGPTLKDVVGIVGGKMPHGVAALDKMKNPCGEIPLDLWKGNQFFQEASYLSDGVGNVSKFKLQHKPIPGTTTGHVYVPGRGTNPSSNVPVVTFVVASFVVDSNGNVHFTPIGNPINCPHWGRCENGELLLEWPSFPGNNYIVCSYEYVPDFDLERLKSIRPPIDHARWAEILKHTKHKEFVETGSDDFFMPENGENIIRLLPPLNGSFHVCRRQHYINAGAVQCAKRKEGTNWVGECPICACYNKLWHEVDQARSRGNVGFGSGSSQNLLLEKARQLKSVERYYYNVLVNGKVKIFSAGKHLHDQIVALICGDDQTEGLGDIADPVTGRKITLIKEMKGCDKSSFPDYKIIPHRETTPLGTESEVRSIMEKTYNLEAVAKRWDKSPEELNVALQKMLGNDYVAYQTWKNRNEMKAVENEEDEEDFLKALAKM